MAAWRTIKAEITFRWWCMFNPRKAIVEQAKTDITVEAVEEEMNRRMLSGEVPLYIPTNMIEPEMQAAASERWHNEFRESVVLELLHQRLEQYGRGGIPRDEHQRSKRRVIQSLVA